MVEPGAGHFAWSDRHAKYLALFIRKAAEARIPAKQDTRKGRHASLRKIELQSGWLTNLTITRLAFPIPLVSLPGNVHNRTAVTCQRGMPAVCDL